MHKICPRCNIKLPPDAKSCKNCGIEFSQINITDENIHLQDKLDAQKQILGVSQVRPWVRFWARYVDYTIFSIIFALTTTFIMPEIINIPQAVFGLFILFSWIFVEAFFISRYTATPGKWLCKITVRNSNGKKLSYNQALKRSLDVWFRGLGLGLPFISIITQIIAYTRLKSKGITSWDKKGQILVTHKQIGGLKTFFVVFILAAYAGIIAIIQVSRLNMP